MIKSLAIFQKKSINYSLIIITVLFLLVLFSALFLIKSRASAQAASMTQSGNDLINVVPGDSSASQVSFLLDELTALKLDTTFFNNVVLQTLRDFSQPIYPEPFKRRDPFAPIGSDPYTPADNSVGVSQSGVIESITPADSAPASDSPNSSSNNSPSSSSDGSGQSTDLNQQLQNNPINSGDSPATNPSL